GNTIFKFTPEGVKSTFASGIVPETYDPYHVAEVFTGPALDRSGNLFVAEHVSGSILKFTPYGKKSTFASGVSPDKMAVDGAGNLFAADANTIFKFTPDGKKNTFATGINPGDLVFDRAGNLFVTDPGSDSILKFTPDGKKSTFATEISGPGEMAFDAARKLCISGSSLIITFLPY